MICLNTALNQLMQNVIEQVTRSIPDFIDTTKNVCRIYREFDTYSEKEMLIWLDLAVKVQRKANSDMLAQVIEELAAAIKSKSYVSS